MLPKSKKAKVYRRTPFTIQLTVSTGGIKKPVTRGVDSRHLNVGLSAITARKEVYAADAALRDDIVKLNSERRMYRRSRRSRKTWYRKPRFLNRKKDSGWFAPSLRHKLDSHQKLVNRVSGILPVSQVTLEGAAFDIQKIKNPGVSGTDCQNGEQKGRYNVREYVLYRDGHKCTNRKGKKIRGSRCIILNPGRQAETGQETRQLSVLLPATIR